MFKYFLLLVIIIVSSCKEDEKNCNQVGEGPVIFKYCESEEIFSNVPYIENVRLSRSQTNQNDSITIKFVFKDGDGDIGEGAVLSSSGCDVDLCTFSCFDTLSASFIVVLDDRTNCVWAYNIAADFPKQNISLSGEGEVMIASNCCIPPTGYPCVPSPQYPIDTVIYTIRIKDRAGNWSNALQTPPLYISCN